MEKDSLSPDRGSTVTQPTAVAPHGVPRLCPEERGLRPDLAGAMLALPPGRWWTDDGWLRMVVVQVGDPTQAGLPDGWVWVVGEFYRDGEPFDWCTVPVRIDALPPPPSGGPLSGLARSEVSYQTAIDLNYSALLGFSESEFTQPGPGALRGIRKCFTDMGDYRPADVVSWMVDRQEAEFDRLGLPFGGLYGRPLHAIDCQGLFCETDKYCREAVPELASARKQIKARFAQALEPVRLFFPPKWGINDRLPANDVLGTTGPDRPADPFAEPTLS
jgi:hypothetical protein